MLFVSGIGNTFAVFFPSLLHEFGGTRAATASAVTLLWGVGAAVGPVAGYLVPRRAPRTIVTTGLIATTLGLALAASASTLPAFVLAMGVGGGLGVGLTGLVVHAALIADTYVQKRGFAMAVVLSGSMAGPVLAGPLQWAIDHVGWRGAVVCYIGVIVLLIPAAVLTYPKRLRALPRPPSSDDPGVRTVVMSLPFWLLATTYLLAPAVGIMATVQHTLFFTERGYSPAQASFLLALGGVLAIVGRALAGVACDVFGAMRTGIASFLISIVGTLCLLGLTWGRSWLLVAGYLLFLFAPIGSRAPIIPLLLMRITTPARYAMVFGYLSISNSLGAAAGPLVSGALYDLTHSYAVVFGTAVALLLVALGALLVFRRAVGTDGASVTGR